MRNILEFCEVMNPKSLLGASKLAEIRREQTCTEVRRLTVLKLGKSPTGDVASTGKGMKAFMSNVDCIIRDVVCTAVGSGLLWHELPVRLRVRARESKRMSKRGRERERDDNPIKALKNEIRKCLGISSVESASTVHPESIHSNLLFPHFVMLQPYSKME